MIRILLFLAAMGLMAVPAQAGYCASWGYRTYCRAGSDGDVFSAITGRTCVRRAYCRDWVRSAPIYDDRHHYRSPDYRDHFDEDDRPRGRDCRSLRRTVGDQHLTVEGAKKAANDAWAALVRFHIGEKHMDLNNARRVIYTCSRSSIKEGGVTTLGQTLTRCEIEAQPCAPMREHEKREGEK